MSFFKKLFGGGKSDEPSEDSSVEYKGFQIEPAPISEGGQYRVCAILSKAVDGRSMRHRLIRADVCGSAQEAADIAVRKAKQMIDEQGDRLPLEASDA